VSAIGVFDSGAGGLSIVAAIRAAMPSQSIAYYADTAYAPYGSRSDLEIVERTRVCCEQLLRRPLAALVVACNTATANAIDELRTWAPVPVVGVEPGIKPAARESRNGVVGVLATQATLGSRRYRELMARVRSEAPQVRFVERAGRGWVELVEAGELDSVQARERVREAVQPLLEQGADTLVLGCTHYPFLRQAIARAAGDARLVETGPAVARELQRRLAGAVAAPSAGEPLLQLQSSGDEAHFSALAARLLAVLEPPPARRAAA
jgi:glutamate racemase